MNFTNSPYEKMMKEIQPDLVIGCGGYVSGPWRR